MIAVDHDVGGDRGDQVSRADVEPAEYAPHAHCVEAPERELSARQEMACAEEQTREEPADRRLERPTEEHLLRNPAREGEQDRVGSADARQALAEQRRRELSPSSVN